MYVILSAAIWRNKRWVQVTFGLLDSTDFSEADDHEEVEYRDCGDWNCKAEREDVPHERTLVDWILISTWIHLSTRV